MENAQELIQAWCDDEDATAFRRFYRHESERLWRYLVARGAGSEQAYDLVSEAFMRFIQSICKDPISPSAFLFRIAQNLLIDHFRRHGRRELPLDEQVMSEASSEDGQDWARQADLIQAIKKLPRDEQNLLLLRYWIGMTHKEVAAVVGRPEGTVRRQSQEAVRALQVLMEEAQ